MTHEQLGMNPGTAANRLVKDLLFHFVQKAGHLCHRCNEPMARENFSIEHKIPWRHSDNPVGLFFDIDNIAFSHLRCNSKARRSTNKIYHTEEERLEAQRRWQRESNGRSYTPEKRRARYERTGN